MTEYATFRQRLDAALRTRDVAQVNDFMIAEDQWEPGIPTDPEFAMWMMIAGSPTLKEMHAEARTWLIEHDHAEEAEALLNRAQGKAPQGKPQQKKKSGKSGF